MGYFKLQTCFSLWFAFRNSEFPLSREGEGVSGCKLFDGYLGIHLLQVHVGVIHLHEVLL